MRASSVVLRAAARRQGRAGRLSSRRRRHGRRRSRGGWQQVGGESRSLQDLIFGTEPAHVLPAVAPADGMPVLPPHDDMAHVETNNDKFHSSSPLLASAPFEDEALQESARVIRELILGTPQNDRHLIASEFASRFPAHSKTIRQHGGIKAVSQLLPHMYTFGGGGALTAPPLGPARDELLRVAQRTHVRTLCDAFVLAGGSTVPMSLFEREQVDDEGRCIPKAVAIDTEGTHMVPPILIQVCPVTIAAAGDSSNININTSTKVYLEQPRRRPAYGGGSQLSDALKDLLADESVLKVFFDAGGDIASLGVPVNNVLCLQKEARRGWGQYGKRLTPSLVDLFNECSNGGGSASVTNASNDMENSHRILYSKNKTMTRWFQNKKRPTKRLHEKLEMYGAADAWATARIYQHFVLNIKDEEKEANNGAEGNDQSKQRRMTSAEIQAELEQRAEKLMARRKKGAYGSNGIDDGSRGEKGGSLSLMERLGQYIKSFGA